eukprot:TRINITY_DN255_c2_g1_i1.p1 TRINITY_DN255_c2_g1~~TRINITY_DN255_c2_g1_i1.p1  ORF type:complete len:137 (+),score=49.23 TRINITY_DN255_c2_g1_i1:78-488(+)
MAGTLGARVAVALSGIFGGVYIFDPFLREYAGEVYKIEREKLDSDEGQCLDEETRAARELKLARIKHLSESESVWTHWREYAKKAKKTADENLAKYEESMKLAEGEGGGGGGENGGEVVNVSVSGVDGADGAAEES